MFKKFGQHPFLSIIHMFIDNIPLIDTIHFLRDIKTFLETYLHKVNFFVNYDPLYTNELVNYQMLMNLHLHANHRVGLLDLEFPWEGLHLLEL